MDGHRVESFPAASEVHRLYDAEIVDRYVIALQQEMAELRAQLDEANQLAQGAEQKMAEAEAAQALLGRVWLTAQAHIDVKLGEAESQARDILTNAQRQADVRIADTRTEAEAIINEAHGTIRAVFAALTRPAEPGAATAQPTDKIPAAGPHAPPASTRLLDRSNGATPSASIPGPWTTAALADACVDTVTASAGAEIVELSRNERRLHALASRATIPAPQRGGDLGPEPTDERGWAARPAYDPTAADGGAVALTEAEPHASDEQRGDDPLSPPSLASPEECLAGASGPPESGSRTPPAAGVEPQWLPPNTIEGRSLGPPPGLTDSASPWAGSESPLEEPQALAMTRSGETAPWSGLPPTASWSPASPSFGPPARWSSSQLGELPAETGLAGLVTPPIVAPEDAETLLAPPTLAGWRERWRLARDGQSPLDDDVLSRAHRLASLEDGTYVGELRDGPDLPALDDQRAALELLPPPAGPPVILDGTIGHAVEQARVRRPLKRARG